MVFEMTTVVVSRNDNFEIGMRRNVPVANKVILEKLGI